MTSSNGVQTPLQIAVVGSGPSGFYAAEALLRCGHPVRINIFERLPTPFGLVRSGVAPDHPKLKQSISVFERIVQSPEVNFFGNVTVGLDISVEELRETHHAIVFAYGSQNDRRMNIPGEDLTGSHTATEFVGWYNGHPDYRDRNFDLDQEAVAIIGQGNVAADVCRILTKPVDQLRTSDIAEHALDELSRSRVRDIYVIGRRGPAQAKFTTKELRELTAISDSVATVDPSDLSLGSACQTELSDHTNAAAAKNLEIFRSISVNSPGSAKRTIHFRFYASPVELLGMQRVQQLSLVRNALQGPAFSQVAIPSGAIQNLSCGLVFRSIGYQGSPMPGLPFDFSRGILPNRKGRIVDGERTQSGMYVTGWLKRGPSGIIGTNRADSIETVEALLADLPVLLTAPKLGMESLMPILERRCGCIVQLADWQSIDAAEIERGRKRGKPREKFVRIEDMLSLLANPLPVNLSVRSE